MHHKKSYPRTTEMFPLMFVVQCWGSKLVPSLICEINPTSTAEANVPQFGKQHLRPNTTECCGIINYNSL